MTTNADAAPNGVPTNDDLHKAKAKHLRAMADVLDGGDEDTFPLGNWRKNWPAYLLGVVVGLPLAALMAVYMGAVLWLLWGWFVAPLGLPQLTIAWAVGIMLTVGLFHKYEMDSPSTAESIMRLTKPLVLLAAGYVVHRFFM